MFWEWVKLFAWTLLRRQSIVSPVVTMVTLISTSPWIISTSSSWIWIRHSNPFQSTKVRHTSALPQVQTVFCNSTIQTFLMPHFLNTVARSPECIKGKSTATGVWRSNTTKLTEHIAWGFGNLSALFEIWDTFIFIMGWLRNFSCPGITAQTSPTPCTGYSHRRKATSHTWGWNSSMFTVQ